MDEWKLYRQTLHRQVYHYAWVDPEGIIRYNRVIAPLGWVDKISSIVGAKFSVVESVSAMKWRRVSTKMTQEQLAQGWLL